MKNVTRKEKLASAKTTTAKKVEKPPWKTWGPVLNNLKGVGVPKVYYREIG